MVCVGTAECITEAEAARRQSDAQEKAELAQDQILCVKQNSINEAIAACTRLIQSSQLTERELAHVYFLRRKAELAQDQILCAKRNSINEAIAACTRLIQSSQLTERELAYVYFLRSMRWKAQGDVQRSQDDYRESLQDDPFFQNKLSTLLELDNHGVVTFSCGERYCDPGLVCVANNCMTSQQADLAESEDAWHQRRAEYNDAVNKQQSAATKAAYSDFTKRLGIPLVEILIALVVLTILLLIYRLFRNSRSTSVV
jgi:tetratricopeptide (TPR) repeat protein